MHWRLTSKQAAQRRECPKNFECFSRTKRKLTLLHIQFHPCLSVTCCQMDLQRNQKSLVTNLRETPWKMKTVTMMGLMTTLVAYDFFIRRMSWRYVHSPVSQVSIQLDPPVTQFTPKLHRMGVTKITWSRSRDKKLVPQDVAEKGAPGFGQGAPSCAPGCGLGGRLGATDVRRLEGRKRRAAPLPPPSCRRWWRPVLLLATILMLCAARMILSDDEGWDDGNDDDDSVDDDSVLLFIFL